MEQHLALLFLSIASVCPFLATGCSTARGTTGLVCGLRAKFNPEDISVTRSYDRPWRLPGIRCSVAYKTPRYVDSQQRKGEAGRDPHKQKVSIGKSFPVRQQTTMRCSIIHFIFTEVLYALQNRRSPLAVKKPFIVINSTA